MPTPTMSDIASVVALKFQISVQDLRGPRRFRQLVYPRWVVLLLAQEMTQIPIARAARYLGRHHTTALYGIAAVKALSEVDADMAGAVNHCRALLIHRPSWKDEAARSIRENGLALRQAQV